MGRGNVCVFGKYEGLYYIDNDKIDCYQRKVRDIDEDEEEEEVDSEIYLGEDIPYSEYQNYVYDEIETSFRYEEVVSELKRSIKKRCHSFKDCDLWIDRERQAILENKLFYICLCDNQWSIAVMLIQKEPEYGDKDLEGLQKCHYKGYLEIIKEALFEQFDEIGTYSGAWTSGTLKKGA